MNDAEQQAGVAAGLGERELAEDAAGSRWHYEDFPAGEGRYEDLADADALPGDSPRTRLISLGDISAAIRRGKRVFCLAAVVGLVLGGALFVLTKPSYQVVDQVLITNDTSQDQMTQQATNALLAASPTLAATVISKLGLSETPADFLKTYTVTATSNQVLTIAVNAKTAAVATQRATLLAEEFLQYRAKTLNDQQKTQFAAQNQQVDQAQQKVDTLNQQISSAAGSQKATLQAQLVSAQASLSALQASVAASQATARTSSAAMISGSDVLSTSSPALSHSVKKLLLEYVVGGLLGGLVLGIGILAIRAILTDRLRRRSDIADAIGAPVRMSVATAGPGGKSRFRRGQTAKAGGETGRLVGYLRTVVPAKPQGTATLALVAVDNAPAAAAVVTELARSYVHDGKHVLVADLSGGVLAGQLGIEKPGIHAVTVTQDRIVLAVMEPGNPAPVGPLARQASDAAADKDIETAFTKADLVITLATVDVAVGADHLASWTSEAVAVVTAGVSTAAKLYATGEMIRDAGVHLTSAVLLGADTNDDSVGSVSLSAVR